MIQLEEISKIGFGTYRTSINNANHFDAIMHAVNSGCNLIDTASNYQAGNSEKLIGELHKYITQDDTFLITKAGYARGNDLNFLNNLTKGDLLHQGTVAITPQFKHSINRDFLRRQLEQSLFRTGKNIIDCYMIHSPEYYFDNIDGSTSEDEFYENIRLAFEFLEEMVDEGKIRYYGVSSNALSAPNNKRPNISLLSICASAHSVSKNNHFKFIEFPYNVLEDAAVTQKHDGNRSLTRIAQEQGLITVANRPLNANSTTGSIRLVNYSGLVFEDESIYEDVRSNALDLINAQLKRVGRIETGLQFAIVRLIINYGKTINNLNSFNKLFDNDFAVFLDTLYSGVIPSKERIIFEQLKILNLPYVKYHVNEIANKIKSDLILNQVLQQDIRDIQVLLCEKYLASGIDHVLVGMNSRSYIDELKELF
jgi:aryl-alcohol dehydrogenase-like predicted oxidoreductase